jgi:hypothetical protein
MSAPPVQVGLIYVFATNFNRERNMQSKACHVCYILSEIARSRYCLQGWTVFKEPAGLRGRTRFAVETHKVQQDSSVRFMYMRYKLNTLKLIKWWFYVCAILRSCAQLIHRLWIGYISLTKCREFVETYWAKCFSIGKVWKASVNGYRIIQ